MERFLKSIGIAEVDFFSDLSFEMASWDSPAHKVFYMTIRKNNPWDPELLEDFKNALSMISYKYELRFTYVNEPSFRDVKKLFEPWYFANYFKPLDVFFKEIHPNEIVIGTFDKIEKLEFESIVNEFQSYLKWLFYPWSVKGDIELKPEPVIPAVIEELTPVEEPTPIIEEETAPLFAEDNSEEVDRGEDPFDETMEEAEEKRRQELLEAEQRFMREEEAAAKEARRSSFNTAIFRKGNYEHYNDIGMIFGISGGNVEFEGVMFDLDFRVGRSGKIFGRFGIGDERSAIYVRFGESKNGLTAERIGELANGNTYKIRGSFELDSRNGEKQIFLHYIDDLPSKPLRDDPEEEKRVELHLHTKMSAMDAPGDIADYGKVAKNMGMKALAVTDHGVIQGFPKAEEMSKKTGLKVLYGCEFYMFDNPKLAWNPVDTKLTKGKYCVFDFETTGLSCRYDHVTEFGGVIVENGMVVDRLDLMVNPGIHIPDVIQAKTHITDDMVKNSPREHEAALIIRDFIKDYILVSHNASFDMGFMDKIFEMAGIPKAPNPVIDTLAISRFLFPDARAHRLGNLSKNLGLDIYDDESAHRADYDAEVLNSVWQVIIARLTENNIDLTQRDLSTMVSKNHNYFRHLRTSHIIALAKNAEGLKALYRLVSKSHTDYLAVSDVPKIPRFELVAERENLIFGSACQNGEIWEIATRGSREDLMKAVEFYDYVEVQPPGNYKNLVDRKVFDEMGIINGILDIIHACDEKGIRVCATGDCHYVNPEDKILRDIYINAKGLGGKMHPLKVRVKDGSLPPEAPDQYFMSTREMIDAFTPILPMDKIREIVITNTNYIADQIGTFPILKDRLYGPQANLPDSDVRIREICYGNLRKKYGDNPDPEIVARLDKELEGIIGNGYAVTYYIAHLIIKKANDDGYFVGSRGSV
ncbi:MAG: PHP domain-containing protein, partial [Bacilli bacterium]|nr:PHP domain-containing protein [Bacilli bacterium]